MSASQYRHEFKYLISSAQIPLLKNRISGIMKPDPHADASGMYSIRSLYFDDYENHCYYENINGTDPREKFRIRIYNHSDLRVFLECKHKDHGMTRKTACPLTKEQAQSIIEGRFFTDLEPLPPLLRKLEIKRRADLFHPVVIVEYDRFPYIYRDGNVRVTFDCNLSSCSDTDHFFSREIRKRPVMPADLQLMEVKYDGFLPDTIYRSLNLGTLSRTSYSKYTLCRKYTIC